MFGNKPKSGEPDRPVQDVDRQIRPAPMAPSGLQHGPKPGPGPGPRPKSTEASPSPSFLSSDLTVKGNLRSSNDVQVEGAIEGDIRAVVLTIGNTATIRGKVIAEDVIVNGRVIGEIRGIRVRLNKSSRVEGDVVHETIAIESGAHFEGSVKRKENPLGVDKPPPASVGPKPHPGKRKVGPKPPG